MVALQHGVNIMQPDDLAIPAFLRRPSDGKKFRAPRWRKLVASRPEGERWATASRWEVFIDNDVPKLAVGQRLVWVVEGRKWARLHDSEQQVKIGMRDWLRIKADARQVQA
jgi:hypothetical protein